MGKINMKFVFFLWLFWYSLIWLLIWTGQFLMPLRGGFLGPIPLANFDGVHYLNIARNGYAGYEQAFFPLYPLVLRGMAWFLGGNFTAAGIVLGILGSLGSLGLFYKLAKEEIGEKATRLAAVFFLFFPTGFFLAGFYNEGLFLCLILAGFLSIKKGWWLLAGIFGGLASATRLVGVFFVIAIGLIRQIGLIRRTLFLAFAVSGFFVYAFWLWQTYGDPLLFAHVQPAFGANRTGGEIIFLPQVYWRYLKIFFTANVGTLQYWVAFLEFLILNSIFYILWYGWRKKLVRSEYLIFGFWVLIAPTLTGTLSSIPRYALACFPIFMVLAQIKSNTLKYGILAISVLLFVICYLLFSRGYFIS